MSAGERMQVGPAPIDLDALRAAVQDARCGGYCLFEGRVRDHNAGAAVDGLDYEAHEALVRAEGERILAEAGERFDIVAARCVHRTGALAIGDVAIAVAVSAPHRDAAFRACRYIIDEAKRRLPVWKRERYRDRDPAWVANAEAQAPGDDARETVVQAGFTPDYSRQASLPGVGAEGQARLAAARVLVIGAGGLGVPALAYLAGAGVGRLGIVDPDRLEASNLHRQVLYRADEVGQWKVDLAARRIAALNPAVRVDTFRGRLSVHDIVAVFGDYDLVLECSDSIASKYLGNDAAVASATPIVFASVYQFEGQLHAWSPQGRSPCLRCLWPQPPDPASVGTCAGGGVLGTVPGVLGALQANEALKRLLGLPGVIEDRVLLVDLLAGTVRSIAATRRGDCLAHAEVAQLRAGTGPEVGMELECRYASLADAQADGWTLVDVRRADERVVAPMPLPALWLPFERILAGDADLPPGRHLVICAHGQRSLYAAQLLRARGHAQATSLAGGLAGLGIGR